jgi:hypothetical protein
MTTRFGRLHWVRTLGLVVVGALALGGCVPGYVKASELEQRDQGPSSCARSCEELKMRMVALVLVGDAVPGCVCQVLEVQGSESAPAPAPASPPAPGTAPAAAPPPAAGAPVSDVASQSAAASTGGFVVIAAAAAAQERQLQQQQLRSK